MGSITESIRTRWARGDAVPPAESPRIIDEKGVVYLFYLDYLLIYAENNRLLSRFPDECCPCGSINHRRNVDLNLIIRMDQKGTRPLFYLNAERPGFQERFSMRAQRTIREYKPFAINALSSHVTQWQESDAKAQPFVTLVSENSLCAIENAVFGKPSWRVQLCRTTGCNRPTRDNLRLKPRLRIQTDHPGGHNLRETFD